MIWPATGRTLKMNSIFDAFVVNKAPATAEKQPKIEDTVRRIKNLPKTRSAIGCAAELVAGFLAVLYLLAALALGAALLLYTFFQ